MAKLKKLVIGAPRTGEKDESEVRWLMSYSDFMMQLVCLFILLYSVSSLDKGRMARVAASYRASVGIGELAAHDLKSQGDLLALGDRSLLGGDLGGGDLPRGLLTRVEPTPARGWSPAFEGTVFGSGSALPTPEGARELDRAARLLRAFAGPASVSCSGEASGEGDPLALATARAQAVMERLVRAGVDPRFLTATGRAGGASAQVSLQIRTE